VAVEHSDKVVAARELVRQHDDRVLLRISRPLQERGAGKQRGNRASKAGFQRLTASQASINRGGVMERSSEHVEAV
jgi:hypothetical protein